MSSLRLFAFVPFLVCSMLATAPAFAEKSKQPNVIVIMTDNHGAWTLGCYGNKDIRTPNIDRLAKEGTLFSNAFASNPVCSPTRATFLTGLIPSQHGVHCFLRGGRLQTGPEARSTLEHFRSLPEVLNEQGYSCGLVGKWHLGDNMNRQEGFEDYWITMPHGGTSTFYDAQIIEDGKLRKEPQYLTDFWTDHAVKFLKQSATQEKPFFLFLSYNGPYSLSRLLLRKGQNRHADYYETQELASFPREPAHPWQFNNLDYHNNPVSIQRVATEVSGVDDGVGRVLETLEQLKLDENTLVLFIADQGWAGGHGGFFGMGDHTRPVTADEEMMRIPMVWWQPGKIAAGATTERLVSNYDVMPTLLSHLGYKSVSQTTPPSPGADFSQELVEANSVEVKDPAVFYEFESLRCIRTDRWKYVHRHPNGPHELYDLENDPDEFNNLVNDESHQSQRDRLKTRLDAFYAQYAEPKYDMWNGGGAQSAIFVGIDEEQAQLETVDPPALPEDFVVPEFTLPEGYEIELAAGPPLVQHPTFATFDDQGRLYVCENAGVNLSAQELEEQLPNSIRLLEDKDGDGHYDKSTVFADNMTFPMGGAWQDGALYVASPPYIWRLEDTDNDGVADKRDAIVSKFGYTGNAASIHGCVNGPDGRIYWCDGFHGHEFQDDAGNVTSQRKGSYIFSSLPNGKDVRIHCGGGMDNPVEVDFTSTGDMLGTVNILYTRPRVDCFVHWLHGGAYPHREQVLSELMVTGEFLGPVHRFGHVAVSGATRYRSGVMDHRWRDNFFATFFNSGKVVRLEMEQSGSSYEATQREFLSSQSREFHPTDVVEDADGSLLVVDTGGWFYRGCPTSQFAKPDILGGIYRIRRKGMTTFVDPRGLAIDWDLLSNDKLVRLLGDTRYAVRERAVAACANRGEGIIPLLEATVKSRDLPDRMGAVWALCRIAADSKAAAPGLRIALSDRHPDVRQAACKSLANYPDPESAKLLIGLLNDEPHVRRAAAVALGRLQDQSTAPAILKNLEQPRDRSTEHALIYALLEICQASDYQLEKPIHPSTQKAYLLVMEQTGHAHLKPEDVIPFGASADSQLQKTVIQIFSRHPDWSAQTAQFLKQIFSTQTITSENIEPLRKLIANSLKDPQVAQLVGEQLKDAKTETRSLLLSAMIQSSGTPTAASWIPSLKQFLASEDLAVVEQTIAAVASLDSQQFKQELTTIAEQDQYPLLTRVAAREALSGSRGRLSDDSFNMLLEAIEDGSTTSAGAARLLGSSNLSTSQLLRLAKTIKEVPASLLAELIRPYERSRVPEVATAFLDSMAQTRAITSVSPVLFSEIIKRYPQEYLEQANELLQKIRLADQMKLAKIDSLLSLLDKGDAARGELIFKNEKAKCASCHRVGDKGGKIGPDLTTIGANRAARDLLESIVFPSATIVRDYEQYVVVTTEGRVLPGLIARETSDQIVLQPSSGDPITISKSEIESMTPSTTSVMPKGLEEALTEQQLADVVAYLQSLKPEPTDDATK